MDSISSVSPSILLPPSQTVYHHSCSRVALSLHRPRQLVPRVSPFMGARCFPKQTGRRLIQVASKSRDEDFKEEEETGSYDGDVERALYLDGTIPGTSDEFVKRVSSRAYDMRRNLQQTFESSSYDVLEANPWRGASKPVYVLTHRENQLCTMRTRRNRSEVEKELGQLFSKLRQRGTQAGNQPKQSSAERKFQMLVEDITEGVLVFEDENEAAKYCDLLQGKGQGCEGVAEIEASSVFDLCQKMKALAVLFRKGRTPPLPESLELNLRAKKRSMEDEDEDAPPTS